MIKDVKSNMINAILRLKCLEIILFPLSYSICILIKHRVLSTARHIVENSLELTVLLESIVQYILGQKALTEV